MEKAELIITALQQRIGEMSASYELEKAILRAEYTELQNKYDELNKQKAIDEYSQNLSEQISKVTA
jgi:Rps23 Pro-64 3,4-dihydroxylase Tpa1-like proline 4-hydroxylase